EERLALSAESSRVTSRATDSANFRLHVIKMARASGSCSACAKRSAAIHDVFPLEATITISVGPAQQSIAQSRATNAFAAVTYRLPGPTILSTRGMVLVP